MFNFRSLFKFGKSNGDKKPERTPKDPVCGMRATNGIDLVYKNIKYSFCSDHCRQQFEKDPEAYSA